MSSPRRNVIGGINRFTVTYVNIPGNKLCSHSVKPSCPLTLTKQVRLLEKQELEPWQRRPSILGMQRWERAFPDGNLSGSTFITQGLLDMCQSLAPGRTGEHDPCL